MKGIVTIFAMPQEIDDLYLTLVNLKRNVALLSPDVVLDLHLTLCVSDELTNWETSKITKEYIVSKFNSYLPLCDWSKNSIINIEEENGILGCASQRRFTLNNSTDYDFNIWLDTDIFFRDDTLFYLIEAYKSVNNPHTIVTPQIVRQWDTTWDVLVNKPHKNNEIGYYADADIVTDVITINDEISAIKLDTFKFAGGWVTLLGRELLTYTGIPDSFGHYGLEDTYVMECCKVAEKYKLNIVPAQYVIKNMIVGENYRYKTSGNLSQFITSTNRKEEFKAISTQNFTSEIKKFYQNNK